MAPKRVHNDEPQVGEAKNKHYTWQEIAKHNSEESCWVYIEDKVYDITSWLERHPGGKEMLMLSAGRDLTDMFTTYHPFTTKPKEILHKFEIGTLKGKPEFPRYKQDTGFYQEVRKEVGAYFEKKGLDPKNPVPGLWRLALFFLGAAMSLYVAYDTSRNWVVRILAAQFFGVCQALPLLHSMHDASHTAIGSHPLWWRVIGRLNMDWLAGASLTSWHNQHVVGHHIYTNVLGADPDLPATKSGDIRRVTRQQYWCFPYKFQHIYLMVLYGFLAVRFRINDITGLISKMNGPIRVNQHGLADPLWQFAVKTTWFIWRFVLPSHYLNIPAWQLFVLFLVSDMVTGWYLTLNFQVSHVSPSVVFPDITSDFKDEWAVAQVKTTVDYAHNNYLVTFLSGALNYQVVHHLLPSVSQYHYPAIAPIIMKICKKHNVPYTVLPDFTSAIYAHFKHMQMMGDKSLDEVH